MNKKRKEKKSKSLQSGTNFNLIPLTQFRLRNNKHATAIIPTMEQIISNPGNASSAASESISSVGISASTHASSTGSISSETIFSTSSVVVASGNAWDGIPGYLVFTNEIARGGVALPTFAMYGDAAIVQGNWSSAAYVPVMPMNDAVDAVPFVRVRGVACEPVLA